LPGQEAPKDAAAQEAEDKAAKAAEANRREITAGNARIAMAKTLSGIEHQQADVKEKMLTGDKMALDRSAVELTRKAEIARLDGQRAQSLNKENLSAAQKGIIQGEYNAGVARANQQAKDSLSLLDAQNKIEQGALDRKAAFNTASLKITQQEAMMSLQMLTGERYANELRQADLTASKEKLQVQTQLQESLAKENQSDKQRQLARLDAERQLQEIEQRRLVAIAVADEKRVQEYRILELMKQAGELGLRVEQARQNLRMKSLDMGQYEVAIAQAGLESVIAQFEVRRNLREALAQQGKSEVEILQLRTRAENDIALIRAKEKNDVDFLLTARDKELAALRIKLEVQQYSLTYEFQALELQSESTKMSALDLANAQEELALRRKLLDIAAQRENAKQSMGKGPLLDQELRRLDELEAGERKLSLARGKYAVIEDERRKSFSYGWTQAFKKYQEDSENYSKLGGDSFGAVISGMNAEIDTFAKTGEFSFGRMTAAILQDITLMIAKFYAMQMVLMTLKALGFGGAGVSLGSGIQMSGGIGSMPMAASGGEIDRPTIVGENGPEIFIPGRRGTVIPNIQAGQYASGGASTVYNGPYIANMNAIDTQSGVQFLSKNKSTIWAANQSAQRGLPMSK
jgi:hypothetical protein